jgi:nucleotide-binding universal stress UspA family protein
MVIVVGYAPGPPGEAALRRGAEEARLRGAARLVVVNSSRGDALVDRRFAQAEDLERVERTLAATGVPWSLHQPVRGREASEEIVLAAHEARADLIVIGLRHRSPVGKLLMGSTAQSVLLDAECPVLAVKAER